LLVQPDEVIKRINITVFINFYHKWCVYSDINKKINNKTKDNSSFIPNVSKGRLVYLIGFNIEIKKSRLLEVNPDGARNVKTEYIITTDLQIRQVKE